MINKINTKKIIFIFISFIFLGIIIFSLTKIVGWKNDQDKTKEKIKEIEEIVNVEEKEDNENTEVIEQEDVDKFNPYWDYIYMNLINVDFNELKNINSDTKGWIQVSGTTINYPFVQTSNNDYYLNRSFDQSYNTAGWVYLDYRNNIYGNERNTIIYAHGRLDNTMFGSLRTILTSGWLNNSANYTVRLSTEYENTLWQVFSVYRIEKTGDYLVTDFVNDDDFMQFANMLVERSQHNFNTNINSNDRILTLSTCYNDNERVVLHAKLIKREGR